MTLVTQSEARSLFGGGGAVMRDIVARVAEPRETAAPLFVPEAETASLDVRSWISYFETHDLEVADPAEAELRTPGLFPSWSEHLEVARPSLFADVVGGFTASFVAVQQDEMSFLASWKGAAMGAAESSTSTRATGDCGRRMLRCRRGCFESSRKKIVPSTCMFDMTGSRRRASSRR
ncbi:MAG: hypothetical protein HC923_09260 [Myxococcales bacterium]|nr:hypothetical protein [Myxococcales bacterium]